MHICLLKMNKKMNNISVKISSHLRFDYDSYRHTQFYTYSTVA